jgi:NB-ARC domain-containing protein/globin
VLILVFSEHANESDHVQREVAKAFSSGLAVIPFRIKDVLPDQSLSFFLDTVQWLDASAPPLQKHLGTLSERVKKLLVDKTTRKPPKRLGPEKISVAIAPINKLAAAPDFHRKNLPAQPTPFIGRQAEVKAGKDLLMRESVHLVTLTGPGGTGKTRLALQAAADLINRFEDGVYFVDLAPIREPESVLAAIAQTVGLRETSDRPGFKYLATEMVCWAAGGPQKYTGRSMYESHKDMKITGPEWDAFMDDFQQTLDKFSVPAQEQAELKAIVESTRADIVVKPEVAATS